MGLQIFDNVNLAQVTFLKVMFYLGLLNSLELKVRGRLKNVPSELSLLFKSRFYFARSGHAKHSTIRSSASAGYINNSAFWLG